MSTHSSPTAHAHRVAIMQPYFFPHGGYFRLFSQVDEFVLLDCVQFPRTGRVHRSEVARRGRPSDWLTLPLARQPRETIIADLAFADGARREFDDRLAAQPWIRTARGPAADQLREYLHGPMDSVVDFLQRGLELVLAQLGLHTPISRSSALDLPPELRAQDRILAIAGARGARSYLNAPGGRALYDPAAFEAAGIQLRFLEDYRGEFTHLLPALMQREPMDIARDILDLSAPAPLVGPLQ
ncbi:MAG: hypothetical protein A3E01_20120 [Gammaproteobacteria bacterium RIFCSPHIGHO2_12_FULL_63_22]|nr:MAG: hypothetical protein A3E01_20120 [Gammaproteobacteria bacterium RIFCSPHIGHO2_12_FULL_63_22]